MALTDIYRISLFGLAVSSLFFLIGCSEEKLHPAEISAVRCKSIKLDGRLDEAVWQKAYWIPLDVIYPTELLQRCDKKQYEQIAKAAVIWDERGLYVAMMAEDFDIQGNKRIDNDWIWLEDVMEVFMAPIKPETANKDFHVELQVNPAGTTFAQELTSQGWQKLPRKSFEVAVYVNGTLNNSAEVDKTFSCEWFISWDTIKSLKLLEASYIPRSGAIPFKMRFAAWDINIYSQIRINRLSAPGAADPHQVEYYRPLILK